MVKKIMGMGNPLLDISAVVGQDELDKWGVTLNNAILAEDKHKPLYQELIDKYPEVLYIAGGATQNSIRVAQWMLTDSPNSTAFVGCIGTDANGSKMKEVAGADGVNTHYMMDAETPTGTCAVLVKDGERSLIANLSAANNYKIEHFQQADTQAIVADSEIFYISGFFLTVCPPAIIEVGKHCVETGKVLCMNLSAPFIPEFFKDPLAASIEYCDFVFGNESEAAVYGKVNGYGEDIKEVAKKLAALPKKCGTHARTVIFTQGSLSTLVCVGGVVTEYPVVPLEKSELVDTNGAGDSFVGGFLAMMAQGKSMKECVDAGHWAARMIIQENGCSVPKGKTYMA